MIKHTQTIRRQKPTSCFSVFDHFVKLALKGLKQIEALNTSEKLQVSLGESLNNGMMWPFRFIENHYHYQCFPCKISNLHKVFSRTSEENPFAPTKYLLTSFPKTGSLTDGIIFSRK